MSKSVRNLIFYGICCNLRTGRYSMFPVLARNTAYSILTSPPPPPSYPYPYFAIFLNIYLAAFSAATLLLGSSGVKQLPRICSCSLWSPTFIINIYRTSCTHYVGLHRNTYSRSSVLRLETRRFRYRGLRKNCIGCFAEKKTFIIGSCW
jgi:hypothetical protein